MPWCPRNSPLQKGRPLLVAPAHPPPQKIVCSILRKSPLPPFFRACWRIRWISRHPPWGSTWRIRVGPASPTAMRSRKSAWQRANSISTSLPRGSQCSPNASQCNLITIQTPKKRLPAQRSNHLALRQRITQSDAEPGGPQAVEAVHLSECALPVQPAQGVQLGLQSAMQVEVQPGLTIPIPRIEAMLIMTVLAWRDRGLSTQGRGCHRYGGDPRLAGAEVQGSMARHCISESLTEEV